MRYRFGMHLMRLVYAILDTLGLRIRIYEIGFILIKKTGRSTDLPVPRNLIDYDFTTFNNLVAFPFEPVIFTRAK